MTLIIFPRYSDGKILEHPPEKANQIKPNQIKLESNRNQNEKIEIKMKEVRGKKGKEKKRKEKRKNNRLPLLQPVDQGHIGIGNEHSILIMKSIAAVV